jgi:anthranilate phosphoribosyltransferase
MSISHYIKEIGRGKQGARNLSREQAADLWGQLLDGGVTDLEVGAFCIAMRVKGETEQEMAGFLDATHGRLARVTAAEGTPVVVIPSYNGARKLPVLTPLLALLLARRGLSVLVHGTATEASRVGASPVFAELGLPVLDTLRPLAPGEAVFVPTGVLHPGLQRLLEVRRVIGLRNPAHALVKLMNPVVGKSLLVTSYTHPEYLQSMSATLALMQADALLLRGTEGEAVADPRRMPQMDGFVAGRHLAVQAAQPGSLATLPELPKAIDADSTAAYIRDLLDGHSAVPAPVAAQVAHILRLVAEIEVATGNRPADARQTA